MTIFVSGGRDFNDWDVFKRSMDRLTIDWNVLNVYNGHDGETDHMAERYFSEKKMKCPGIPVSPFISRADAVRFRNMDLIGAIDGAVLFWDGKSPEMAHLIGLLRMCNRRFVVFNYYGELMENFTGR